MIFRYDLLEQILAGFDLLWRRRRGRINDRGPDHFSRRVHYRQLASRAECRVPAEHDFSGNWRLHKKLVQVLAEHFDRTVLGLLRQLVPDLALNRRSDQTVITVLHCLLKHRRRIGIVLMYRLFLQISQDIIFRSLYFHGQEFFLLSTV